jgi:hypothetical protein
MFTPFDTVVYDSNIIANVNKIMVENQVGTQYATLTTNQTISNKTFVAPILGNATATSLIVSGNATATSLIVSGNASASALLLLGNAASTNSDIQLNNGLTIKSVATALANNGATTLSAGTILVTSNATGLGSVFVSNGTAVRQLAFV